MVQQRQGYKIIISPEAEKRIANDECPGCGKPKREWVRRTDWKCCCSKCSYKHYTKQVVYGWPDIRLKALKRDGYKCVECGYRPVTKTQEEYELPTGTKAWRWKYTKEPDTSQLIGDHIIAIALGGEEFDVDNVQTLCVKCNKVKTWQDSQKIMVLRRKDVAEKIEAKHKSLKRYQEEK